MTWAALEKDAHARHLRLLGAFHPAPGDKLDDVQTLVLLGPHEPGFWQALITGPEWGGADPVDTWSERVIGAWANDLGAAPYYPFSGPPWFPFIDWAKRSGRMHPSPVGMLVHDEVGLFVSFRGALGLREHIDLPPAKAAPCNDCAAQPCRQACPVDALKGDRYETGLCKDHLKQAEGHECLTSGCRARLACPVSAGAGRSAPQSAYHMQRFLRG